MFSELGNCKYYVEQFNDLLQKQKNDNNRSSFMHVNARSLQCNLSGLTNLLVNLNLRFSFIGITETWLQDSSHNSNISGYRFIHKHRINTSGAGVGLYLADSLEFKWRSDISLSSDETAESLFVEVNRPKERNLIVGVIYRPPKQSITRISKQNTKCYIMADWNIDLMKHQSHDKTGEFLDIMFSRSFFPLISRPTRITSNSATLIDIFTNDQNNCSASGLLFPDISDHPPILTILSDHCKNTSENIYVTFRDKNSSHMTAFKAELHSDRTL